MSEDIGVLAFIGAGNMCDAILSTLLKEKFMPVQDILLSDKNTERLSEMSKRYSIRVTGNNHEIAKESDVIILSVKTQNISEVMEELRDDLSEEHVIISIAMGCSTDSIESHLNVAVPVIRVMPNTPAHVSASISAISYGSYANEKSKLIAKSIFSTLGEIIEVDEKMQDEVGAISGCGPAYFYMLIEAFGDAGVRIGLERKTALKLATETMIGSGLMIKNTGMSPSELRYLVTSPGGTTIAGIEALEKNGFRAAVFDAVMASLARARDL